MVSKKSFMGVFVVVFCLLLLIFFFFFFFFFFGGGGGPFVCVFFVSFCFVFTNNKRSV